MTLSQLELLQHDMRRALDSVADVHQRRVAAQLQAASQEIEILRKSVAGGQAAANPCPICLGDNACDHACALCFR